MIQIERVTTPTCRNTDTGINEAYLSLLQCYMRDGYYVIILIECTSLGDVYPQDVGDRDFP